MNPEQERNRAEQFKDIIRQHVIEEQSRANRPDRTGDKDYLLSMPLVNHIRLLEILAQIARADSIHHNNPDTVEQWARRIRQEIADNAQQKETSIGNMKAAEKVLENLIDHVLEKQQFPNDRAKENRGNELRRSIISWKYSDKDPASGNLILPDLRRRADELVQRSGVSNWLFSEGDKDLWKNLFNQIDNLQAADRINQYDNTFKTFDLIHGVFDPATPTGQLQDTVKKLSKLVEEFDNAIKPHAKFIEDRYIDRINQRIKEMQTLRDGRGRRAGDISEEELRMLQTPEGREQFFENMMFLASADPTTEFHWNLPEMNKFENLKDNCATPAEARDYVTRQALRQEIHIRTKSALYETFDIRELARSLQMKGLNFEILTKGDGLTSGEDYVIMANQLYEAAVMGVLQDKYLRWRDVADKLGRKEPLSEEEQKIYNRGVLIADEDITPNKTKAKQFQDRQRQRGIFQEFLNSNQNAQDYQGFYAEQVLANKNNYPPTPEDRQTYERDLEEARNKDAIFRSLIQERDSMNLQNDNDAFSNYLSLTTEQEMKALGLQEAVYSPIDTRVYKGLEAYLEQKLNQAQLEGGQREEVKKQERYKLHRALFFARAHNALSLRLPTINSRIGIMPTFGAELYGSPGSAERIIRTFNYNKMILERFGYFSHPLIMAETLTMYKDFFKDMTRQFRMDRDPRWKAEIDEWRGLEKEAERIIKDPKIVDGDPVKKHIAKMEEFFMKVTGLGYNELIAGGFMVRVGSIYDATTWRNYLNIAAEVQRAFAKIETGGQPRKSWKEFALGVHHQLASDIITEEINNFHFVDPLMAGKNMDFLSHLQAIVPQTSGKIQTGINSLISKINQYQANSQLDLGKEIVQDWGTLNKERTKDLDLSVKQLVVAERKKSIFKLMAKRTPTVLSELFPQKIKAIVDKEEFYKNDPQKYEKWQMIYQALMLSQGQITREKKTGDTIEAYFSGSIFRSNLRLSDYLGVFRNAPEEEFVKAESIVGEVRRIMEDWDRGATDDQRKERMKLYNLARHPFSLTISLVDVPYDLTDYQQMGGSLAAYRRLDEVGSAQNSIEALGTVMKAPQNIEELVKATHEYVAPIDSYEGKGDDRDDPCGGGSIPRARRLVDMTIQTLKSSDLIIPQLESLFVNWQDQSGGMHKYIKEIASKWVSVHVKHRGSKGISWEGPDIAEYLELLRIADVFMGNHAVVKQLKNEHGATQFSNMMFQARKLLIPIIMWAVITAMASELQKKEETSS